MEFSHPIFLIYNTGQEYSKMKNRRDSMSRVLVYSGLFLFELRKTCPSPFGRLSSSQHGQNNRLSTNFIKSMKERNGLLAGKSQQQTVVSLSVWFELGEKKVF